jgi:hypothetical protein
VDVARRILCIRFPIRLFTGFCGLKCRPDCNIGQVLVNKITAINSGSLSTASAWRTENPRGEARWLRARGGRYAASSRDRAERTCKEAHGGGAPDIHPVATVGDSTVVCSLFLGRHRKVAILITNSRIVGGRAQKDRGEEPRWKLPHE